MFKRVYLALVGFALSVMGVAAHAAIDVTAVTTGISDAQTSITTIIMALIGLSTAIFGLSKVYSFLRRRAGA